MNSDPLMPGSYRLFLGVRELLSSLSPKTMLPKRSRGIPHLNNQQVSAKIEKKNNTQITNQPSPTKKPTTRKPLQPQPGKGKWHERKWRLLKGKRTDVSQSDLHKLTAVHLNSEGRSKT